ncbi:hypothetical protein CQA49_04955 [Helicobacter sp. MIT 00-7814]|uniref:hypothetical protein n=1 Tax=unclassified Helicobacter TaxID=2593540 RepID=UPI000E1F3A95|nr:MULTISPECIES: hypothetical protein [unclassified Helicobacter]RDU54349.1 hypothetical protein CQA37_05445 [Helicobacter sp. MIT 99-10781]RDU54426.1 hypothetical protein CQA49_04955 [Helicobacter sp. MIT 00-7814]
MGDVTAAASYQAGGVTGMRAMGTVESGWNFATATVSNVAMIAPGGGVAKLATNTGVISANSRYAVGLGKYNQMMENKAFRANNALTNGGNGGNVTMETFGSAKGIVP